MSYFWTCLIAVNAFFLGISFSNGHAAKIVFGSFVIVVTCCLARLDATLTSHHPR